MESATIAGINALPVTNTQKKNNIKITVGANPSVKIDRNLNTLGKGDFRVKCMRIVNAIPIFKGRIIDITVTSKSLPNPENNIGIKS